MTFKFAYIFEGIVEKKIIYAKKDKLQIPQNIKKKLKLVVCFYTFFLIFFPALESALLFASGHQSKRQGRCIAAGEIR